MGLLLLSLRDYCSKYKHSCSYTREFLVVVVVNLQTEDQILNLDVPRMRLN